MARHRPRKAAITLRIDRNVMAAARNYARQRRVPLAEVVRGFLVHYVRECAHENDQTLPDLFGLRPRQFPIDGA